ncbi:tripartite tricarboxylate transporter TctB family protein [Litorisediminicola beolgyonensis]|uniref:Tripartite tricarboxylate transporter TctB family protein n=1 Tax=Litorisediminicola beolgyonensis TaxID=1173614 RepID=A0ABW3ZJH2_9RHOB
MAIRIHDPAGSGVAAIFILLGLFLVWQTGSMTPMGSVFPVTVSVAMIVFSAILILRNLVIGTRRGASATAPKEVPASNGSYLRRGLFLVAMVAWVLLIPILGFLAASALGYFAIMLIALHERMAPAKMALMVVLGAAILAGIYLLMSEILLIPMPRGLLF